MLTVTAMLQYACATSPDAIKAARVDVAPYMQMDCIQLRDEHARISASLNDAHGLQAAQLQHDSATVGVAVLMFTPIIAAIRGDGSMAAEVGRLKGEKAAIEKAITLSACPVPPQQQAK